MTEIKDKLVTLEDLKTVTDNMSDILGINDMTTGINLLRGTRDFDLGREYETFGTDSGYFSDGFRNSGAFTFYTDEDGFTVAHRDQSGLSADAYKYIYGSIVHLEPGEVVTYGFEFMVDDASAWDRKFVGQIQCFEAGTSVSTFKIDLYPGIVGVSTVESGKWYKARYTLDQKVDKATDVRFGLYLIRNGSINFKRVCVYKGDITNPVWSPSPFDTIRNVLKRNSPIYNLGYVESNYIQGNEDLNDYIFAGTYACASGVTAQSLDNCPATSAFKLYVEYSSGGQTKYIHQKLKTYNSYAITFFRYSEDTGSTWTDWRQTYENYEIRPIGGGGTGADNVMEANYNILKDVYSSDTKDETLPDIDFAYISKNPNKVNGALRKIPKDSVWNWIASKIRSVFGFTDDDKLPVERLSGTISLEDVYPVGSLYITTDYKHPAEIFGGNWAQIEGGVLRATYLSNDLAGPASVLGKGGSDTVAHWHMESVGIDDGAGTFFGMPFNSYQNVTVNDQKFVMHSGTLTKKHTFINPASFANGTLRLNNTSNATVNNLPAYKDFWVWQRLQGALQGGGSAGAGSS